ncbi:unnamed protein product [Orchesella dallaii]|uniref:Paired amphipathic helix protein Sin3a n=1 Tax=Orchesella dallaii TaxID=48710 RepID=A0ABP1R497_9HEXA
MDNANNAEMLVGSADAEAFIDHLKQRYQQHPHVFNSFLVITNDLVSKRIDAQCAIDRVKVLLQGDPEMSRRFNVFLYTEHRIEVNYGNDPNSTGQVEELAGLPLSDGAQNTDGAAQNPSLAAGPLAVTTGPQVAGYHHELEVPYHGNQAQSNGRHFIVKQSMMPPNFPTVKVQLKVEDCLSFLEHMEQRYHQNPQTCRDFLDIMKDVKSKRIDNQGLIDRVTDLFQGDPEMLKGFAVFLPPEYRVVSYSDRN